MRHTVSRWVAVFYLAIFSAAANPANAVDAGAVGGVSGRVIDKATKQPLPNASVAVMGTTRGTLTDEAGRFTITRLAEDVYKLEIRHIGYEPFLETDVRVVRGKSALVQEIELAPAFLVADEVVVAAGYFREDSQAPVSAYTYTREEIRRTPGATGDVFRAMETLPGVSTSGGEFAAFSVRGNSPKENIILIDNIPFDKVSHFNGGSSEEQEKQGGRFSIFAPNLIEEARFQAGGFSAAYGGKLASFLDLKVREGNPTDVTVDGRWDITGWEANFDGPLGSLPRTGVILSARQTNFTRILEWTGQDDFGRPRFTDLIVKTTTELNDRHKLSVLGLHTPEAFDRELKHVFLSDDHAASDIIDFGETKSLLGVNWRYLTGAASVLQTSVYARRTDRRVRLGVAEPSLPTGVALDSRRDLVSRERLREDVDESEVGTRSVFVYALSERSQLTAGMEASQTRYDRALAQNGVDTLYTFDADDARTGPDQKYAITTPDQVDASYEESRNRVAVFGEWGLTPVPRLTVNTGLRFDYSQLNRRSTWSPRLSSTYRLTDRTRLNLGTGVYYQTPEFDVVAATPQNGDLANERALHVIGGLTHYLRDDLKLTSEVYAKRFDDLIVRPDRTMPSRTNAGDGWAGGIDLSLIKRLVGKAYGQVNYSYAVSRRDDHDGRGSYDSDFNQPHIFSLLGGYEIDRSWSVSAKWRYATGRPTDAAIIHADIFADPRRVRYAQEIVDNNGSRLPDFHTFNLRIDHRRQLGRVALVGFLDVVNAYGHLNVNEARFLPLTGGTERRGFEILPTAGLKLEL